MLMAFSGFVGHN